MTGVAVSDSGNSLIASPSSLGETARDNSSAQVRQMTFVETMKQDRGEMSFSDVITKVRAESLGHRRSSIQWVSRSTMPGDASESAGNRNASPTPVDHLPEEALSIVSKGPNEGGRERRGTGAWMAMRGRLAPSSPSKVMRPVPLQPPSADPTLQQPEPSHPPRPAAASKYNKYRTKGATRFSLRKLLPKLQRHRSQKLKEERKQGEEKHRRLPEAANVNGGHDPTTMPNPEGFVNWEPVEQRGLEWDPQQRRIEVPTASARFSTGITSTNTKPADATGEGAIQETLV